MPRGRPSKFSDDISLAICNNLELAMPMKLAAEAEGICEDTLHDWLAKGKAGRAPYASFFRAVTRARAKALKNFVVRSLSGGKGSQAALFHLERRFREHYGPVQKIDHTMISKDVTDDSPEETERKFAAWYAGTVLAATLPDEPAGLVERSPSAPQSDAGAAPYLDVEVLDGGRRRAD